MVKKKSFRQIILGVPPCNRRTFNIGSFCNTFCRFKLCCKHSHSIFGTFFESECGNIGRYAKIYILSQKTHIYTHIYVYTYTCIYIHTYTQTFLFKRKKITKIHIYSLLLVYKSYSFCMSILRLLGKIQSEYIF